MFTQECHTLVPTIKRSFYRVLKIKWQQVLDKWKSSSSKKSSNITKEVFPKLLKKVFEELCGNDTNSF